MFSQEPQFQRLSSWIVSLVTILHFLHMGVSTSYERTLKTLLLFNFILKVQDNMVHGGGRGGAALLTEMVALLLTPGRILLLAIQSN